MRTLFAPLVTLSIEHEFFAGICEDIAITIPEFTAAAIRRGRAIIRFDAGVLRVLREVDDPETTALAGKTLVFGLRPAPAAFESFTEPLVTSRAVVPRLSVTGPGVVGAVGEAVIATGLYNVTPADPDAALRLRVRDGGDRVVRSGLSDRPGTAANLDLRGLDEGGYRLEQDIDGNPATQVVRTLYVSRDLERESPWAVLELPVSAAAYAGGVEFRLVFAARRETVKYVIFAPRLEPAELAQLNVVDRGGADEGRPTLEFERVDPAGNGDVPGGGGAGIVFRSRSAVPRLAKGRRKIQLVKNGNVLIENLPSPSRDQVQPTVVVHLSKVSAI
ncbi:MAG: hypothetical protein ACOYN0_17275 [Phycisphaerales bacterium]